MVGSAAPTHEGETQADPERENEDSEAKEYLNCASCKHPVARAEEIIEQKADTWKQAVYPYELLLSDRDCWCYSATNPGDNRFDVVRILPSAEGVTLRRPPDPEHTWFPGYAWRMAHCSTCFEHLGWGFCAPVETKAPQIEVGSTTLASASTSAAPPLNEETVTDSDKRLHSEHTGVEGDKEVCASLGDDSPDDGNRRAGDGADTAGEPKRPSQPPQAPAWQSDPVFHGLILTKLRSGTYTASQLGELRAREQSLRQAPQARGTSRFNLFRENFRPRQLAMQLASVLRTRHGAGLGDDDVMNAEEEQEMARVLRSLLVAHDEEVFEENEEASITEQRSPYNDEAPAVLPASEALRAASEAEQLQEAAAAVDSPLQGQALDSDSEVSQGSPMQTAEQL